MITMQEIRKKYPQYQDLSDQELADSLHSKHYSDMPKEEFYSKVGIQPSSSIGAFGRALGRSIPEMISGLVNPNRNAMPEFTNPYSLETKPADRPEVNLTPEFLKEKPGDEEHPYAQLAGEFAIPGLSAVRAAKEAQLIPSLLKSGKDIFKKNSPEFHAGKFQETLTPGVETSQENLSELAKRIQHAHKVNESRAVGIKENVLNEAGEELIPKNSDYFKSKEEFKHLPPEAREFHQAFKKSPTIENADKLGMQINNDIGRLMRLSNQRSLERHELEELKHLRNLKSRLDKDMNTTLESINPNLVTQMEKFRKDYATNVVPYNSSKFLRHILKKGEEGKITPRKVTSEFSYPTKEVKKILTDIGSTGKSNVLKNKLINSKDAEDLTKAIAEAKKGGYQHLITSEMEKFSKQLESKINKRNILKPAAHSAIGYGLGALVGNPIIGAGLGLASGIGKDALIKALLRQSTKV